ncbi:uncharacterized protein LOC131661243 [Vicia villosa]|uniref:uncharacterized protein LOC131661243 n=1 Tax=Vicia villosa TaxID=3911 RepID=UPI00273AD7AE|nr:uncharacterized protein LOC131661243 [Vicia villosa]XP_058786687.1 uncharacterized protein LOC131661243 [Vicia villosa]
MAWHGKLTLTDKAIYFEDYESKRDYIIKLLAGVGFKIQLSNYNYFEGVLYCNPHFDQLFKRIGSLEKSFEGTPKIAKPKRSSNNEVHVAARPILSPIDLPLREIRTREYQVFDQQGDSIEVLRRLLYQRLGDNYSIYSIYKMGHLAKDFKIGDPKGRPRMIGVVVSLMKLNSTIDDGRTW